MSGDSLFTMGQPVHKVGGRYGGPGRIVGVTEDLDGAGYRLYSVAMQVADGYGTFIHVFPAQALDDKPDPRATGAAPPAASAETRRKILNEAYVTVGIALATESRRIRSIAADAILKLMEPKP